MEKRSRVALYVLIYMDLILLVLDSRNCRWRCLLALGAGRLVVAVHVLVVSVAHVVV